jgi:hypothetical protein
MAMLTTMVADMKEHFVIDPLISKRQQLLLATQLCRMVLKVCCLLHCHIPYFSRSLLFPSRTTTLLWPLAFPHTRPYAGSVLVRGAGNPSAHEYGSQLSHKRALCVCMATMSRGLGTMRSSTAYHQHSLPYFSVTYLHLVHPFLLLRCSPLSCVWVGIALLMWYADQ